MEIVPVTRDDPDVISVFLNLGRDYLQFCRGMNGKGSFKVFWLVRGSLTDGCCS